MPSFFSFRLLLSIASMQLANADYTDAKVTVPGSFNGVTLDGYYMVGHLQGAAHPRGCQSSYTDESGSMLVSRKSGTNYYKPFQGADDATKLANTQAQRGMWMQKCASKCTAMNTAASGPRCQGFSNKDARCLIYCADCTSSYGVTSGNSDSVTGNNNEATPSVITWSFDWEWDGDSNVPLDKQGKACRANNLAAKWSVLPMIFMCLISSHSNAAVDPCYHRGPFQGACTHSSGTLGKAFTKTGVTEAQCKDTCFRMMPMGDKHVLHGTHWNSGSNAQGRPECHAYQHSEDNTCKIFSENLPDSTPAGWTASSDGGTQSSPNGADGTSGTVCYMDDSGATTKAFTVHNDNLHAVDSDGVETKYIWGKSLSMNGKLTCEALGAKCDGYVEHENTDFGSDQWSVLKRPNFKHAVYGSTLTETDKENIPGAEEFVAGSSAISGAACDAAGTGPGYYEKNSQCVEPPEAEATGAGGLARLPTLHPTFGPRDVLKGFFDCSVYLRSPESWIFLPTCFMGGAAGSAPLVPA